MDLAKILEYLKERTDILVKLSYLVLGLLLAYDALFLDKTPAHTWIEHFPGFWSIFGFGACVIIILVSKWYGKLGIMTREDYYDN
ncbi:hypothetical protein [Desulfonatronospira sp. MSAO_Bac3]|uniref:hypothetical protein n=1 Tax=Desulfonatronospira sp. MSAO_Bac3 TaxID=2293857 RepID=UPI000FEDE2A3|nr:hypothetical protein [Desulfonatronospira sp. MSAO_Bac3]RQD78575.1 MAG: hypothetical protein D5S03_01900 [Desulfonatronospira sp. MSAO_Bac3]